MYRPILCALSCILIIGIGEAAADEPDFAHFLEPGFPFAEIVVDARQLGGEFPADNLSPRALVVRLAENTYLAYDMDLCRVACAWSGGFLTEESLASMSYHQPKKKKGGGQKKLPSPVGTPIFANGLYPGVQLGGAPLLRDPRPVGKDPGEIGRGALPDGMARWGWVMPFGEQLGVSYHLGGTLVMELPFAVGPGIVAREISVSPHPEEALSLVLGTGHCAIRGKPEGAELLVRDGVQILVLARSEEESEFTVVQSAEPIPDGVWGDVQKPEGKYREHWSEEIVTRGRLGTAEAAYVVDHIGLPTDNPWRRNVRPSGIDFFPDGRAVVVTFDGDVWIASGLDGGLGSISWRRIAAGLHEPNEVRVGAEGEIFVFGRGGITRLDRLLGSGEVRMYKNHCSDFWQSADTRDFAHSMAIDAGGAFFISKGGQQNDFPSMHSGRALKVAPDGRVSVFASGLRNAYLSIRPGTGEIYASDQQGHWVPSTPIFQLVEGGYYGFRPAAPWGQPEPEITPPLCWIPHAVGGSGTGSVWADEERFGPVSDSLVYLEFRRPGMLRTYLHEREGQAGTVPMDLDFDFPLLKGAVNPVDGQLYVVGFQIWGTASSGIRGMARVRYTGKPSVLPTRVVAGKRAVLMQFEQAIDPATASFGLRRWNYRRSSGYGSGHFRPDGKAGEELLQPGGVEFSADGRSVLIATPELEPVHQLAVSYDLKPVGGERFSSAAYLTLNEVSPLDLASEGFPGVDLAELMARGGAAADPEAVVKTPTVERGAVVYRTIGCVGCHSVDGSTSGKSGPTWKGLAGSRRKLEGGEEIEADRDYLRESITDPALKITRGYNPKDVGMPSYRGILSEVDIESVILFIESLK